MGLLMSACSSEPAATEREFIYGGVSKYESMLHRIGGQPAIAAINKQAQLLAADYC
jgi:hypothetical protein